MAPKVHQFVQNGKLMHIGISRLNHGSCNAQIFRWTEILASRFRFRTVRNGKCIP